MAAAQGGDRDAMDALLRRHQDRLWAICRRLAGNDADAADALQEAMVLIVRRLDTFDGRARFTTWAHRVTTNACLDELRRRRRRPDPGLPGEDDERHDHRAVPDTTVAVEADVTDRLRFDAALAAVPEEFRAPLVLRDVIGHDYGEIAEILELAPGTVRSRIARGRRRLLDALDQDTTSDGNQPPGGRRPSTTP